LHVACQANRVTHLALFPIDLSVSRRGKHSVQPPIGKSCRPALGSLCLAAQTTRQEQVVVPLLLLLQQLRFEARLLLLLQLVQKLAISPCCEI